MLPEYDLRNKKRIRDKQVEVVILERIDPSEEMQEWLSDIQARHPFAKMSKVEIMSLLRQTREAVWTERHES